MSAIRKFILPLFAALWIAHGQVLAQEITQTVRGTVLDATTRLPLAGASVTLLPVEEGKGTSTDEYGTFELTGVPVGRQAIRVSYTGYAPQTVASLMVRSGKETVLTITLEQAPYELEEVEVQARDSYGQFERISKVDISSEQFQRIAANYLDPARVVMSSPSIANTNDQNNAISVRGNSPIANTWRLEGVEIVNPNHLANAGTISDRPTQNGGGVNVLSTQMLDNSAFLMGYMPAGYGNAVGGIFDMNFRRGNSRQREYTAQASLIGLDFAAEGPFRQGGSASYLVNYRYSFTGILAAMGVDFGGESITFQDLSFNLSAPETALGNVTFFGVNGWNSNIYRGPDDPAVWEIDKDLADIDYVSSIYAYGLTHELSLGEKSSWKNVFVYSRTDTERDQSTIVPTSDDLSFSFEEEGVQKLAGLSSWSKRWAERFSTESGLRATWYGWTFDHAESLASDPPGTVPPRERAFDIDGLLLQPFINSKWAVGPNLGLEAGVNSSWFDYTSEFVVEPRLAVELWPARNTSYHLRTGIYSQVLSPHAYHSAACPYEPSGAGSMMFQHPGLSFYKSWSSEAGFQTHLFKSAKLGADAFFQYQYDIPVSQMNLNGEEYFYTYMNYDGEDYLGLLNITGEGRTYGISAELKQQVENGFYFWAGGTFYRSEYKDATGDYMPSKFDGRYNVNLTLGKEYQKKKSDQLQRILGFHSRLFYQGGFRQQAVGTFWSEYDLQLGDYMRLDLRVQWTRFKPKYTQLFAVDIQNVLNIENPAYYYYDSVAGSVILKKQLGMIPVVLYRIDF